MRLTLRELLLATVIVGVALAWWLDRRADQTRLALTDLQIRELQRDSARIRASSNAPAERPTYQIDLPCSFDTPQAYVAFLAQPDGDWDELVHNALGARKPPLGENAAPAVVALLSDPDPRIRARAAIALGLMQARADVAVPALMALLEHPSGEVRYQAVSALDVLRSEAKAAVPALRRIMFDDESELAALAASCIGKIEPQEQLGKRFKQLLTNKHPNNRQIAIRQLRYHLPPDEAKEALVEAFAVEKDAGLRQRIVQALNRLP